MPPARAGAARRSRRPPGARSRGFLRRPATRFAADVALDLMGNHKGGILAALSRRATARIGAARAPTAASRRARSGSASRSCRAATHAVDRASRCSPPSASPPSRPTSAPPTLLPRVPPDAGAPDAAPATSSSIPAPAGPTSAIRRSAGARWRAPLAAADRTIARWVRAGPRRGARSPRGGRDGRRRRRSRRRPAPTSPTLAAWLARRAPGARRRHRPAAPRARPRRAGAHAHGPTDPARHGPYGAPERALCARLPCSFCYRRFDETKACLLRARRRASPSAPRSARV